LRFEKRDWLPGPAHVPSFCSSGSAQPLNGSSGMPTLAECRLAIAHTGMREDVFPRQLFPLSARSVRGSKLVCFLMRGETDGFEHAKNTSGFFCHQNITTACLIKKMDYETFQEKNNDKSMQPA
jgi:hypothetical protein